MIYLMFLSAFALSASAAYYSIAGLVAIFSAAVIPIIIMGGTLEVSKLVVASWLYNNWKQIPLMMKSYFTVALIILMCLTSMGIFGFLSKAHLDQAVPSGDIASKVAVIEEKLKTEKDTIEDAKRTIKQLDEQVNQTISRTSADTTTKGIDRSVKIRKSQAKERKELYSTIQTSQAEISKLNEEKAPVAAQLRKVEAEVGPIKYIAALIYGDNLDESFLEKAVRIVILMIVSVFDPLAVLMLVAANWSLKHRKEEDETKEFFDRGKEIAQALDKADTTGWEKVWQPKSEAWPEWDPEVTEDFDPRPEEKVEWPEDETRIETIGPNGNDGLHYEEVEKGWDPKFKNVIDRDYQDWLDSLDDKDVIDSPAPPTIEKEIEKLQPSVGVTTKTIEYDSTGRKPVEYDAVGRRITP
jgi:hypothetical protein